MTVQKHLFNPISQCSPVVPEYALKIVHDASGNSIPTWVEVDTDEIIRSHGDINMWSLNALLAAGINPADMNIHTGYNTRLEGINDLNSVVSDVEATLISEKNE